MPRWRFRQGDQQPDEKQPEDAQPSKSAQKGTPYVREAETRRLRRLLQRRADIEFDLAQAESARQPVNRWTERIDQLNDAIAQAQADLTAGTPKPVDRPAVELTETPIQTVDVRQAEPATVVLRAGDTLLQYREEHDWAERGHQLSLPQLYRTAGDVTALLPETLSADDRDQLAEHLRHSFATLANDILERTIDGEESVAPTLADLARPCPQCGGWLDLKRRCPRCIGLDWQRQQIRADLTRLTKERNEVMRDLERFRERLPIIRRQLADVEADIESLRRKGVEAG
jgi:hypothetical protein